MDENFQILLSALIDEDKLSNQLKNLKDLSVNVDKITLNNKAIGELKSVLKDNNISLNLDLGKNTSALQKQASQLGEKIGNTVEESVKKSLDVSKEIGSSISNTNIDTTSIQKGVAETIKVIDNYGRELDDLHSKLLATSKMMNTQGKLITLFHGSPKDFDEFKIGSRGRFEDALGAGAYFYDNPSYSVGYGNVSQWYANVEKIFDTEAKLSEAEIKSIYDKYKTEINSIYDINNLLDFKSFVNSNPVKKLNTLSAQMGNSSNSIMKELGYDAIIQRGGDVDTYVVLDENKIIKANNALKEQVSLITSIQEAENMENSNDDYRKNWNQSVFESMKAQRQAEEQTREFSNSVTETVLQNEEKKQQAYQETAQAQNQIAKDESLIKSGKNVRTFDQSSEAARDAATYFDKLLENEKTVISVSERFGNLNGLTSFTVNVKRASGEVESLRYALKNIVDNDGKPTDEWVFESVGGEINNANAKRQLEQVEKIYTDYFNKLNDLKTKYSNTDLSYGGFEKTLSDFRSGIVTVNELKIAFNELQNSAKSGVQNLKSQQSSFDPIQQALNNMRDMPSKLSTLETSMSQIKDKTTLAGISIEDMTNKYNTLQSEMNQNGGKVPLADSWTESYRELMSTVTSATTQVEALRKAEAADNSQATKQANYYSTIMSNYRQMYELKKKSLTASEEETKAIQEQIRSLSASNAGTYRQINAQGLKDTDLQARVDALKKEYEFTLNIAKARQTDVSNTKAQQNAQKESVQFTKELASAYQQIQDLKVKKSSLNTEKDTEKIAQLSKEIDVAKTKYDELYNRLRKRKNFDLSGWKEEKASIDADTKSLIEYNEAKQADNATRQKGTVDTSKNNEINSLNTLKVKWEENGILVGEFKEKVEQLEASLGAVGTKGELNNVKSQLEALKTEASQISKSSNIMLNLDAGTYDAKVQKLIRQAGQWTDANGNARISTEELSKSLNQLKVAENNLNANDTVANRKALIEAERQLDAVIKKTTNDINQRSNTYAKSNQIDALRQKYQDFYDKNTASHRRWGKTVQDGIAELSSGAQITLQRYNELSKGIITVQTEARQAGKLGLSFFDTIKQGVSKFSYWTSSTFIVMKTIQEVKEAVSFAKELDSALTNINYTMNVTSSELTDIGSSAIDMAKDLKTSASNVLEAVTLYANAKETADSILEKSQTAIMLSNVTGMSGSESAKMLQSIMNQFDLTQDDLEYISDTVQSVSQNMAYDFSSGIEEIASGIERSGSVAKSAGLDLAEYASMLGLVIEKTGQSGDTVGNAYKTKLRNCLCVQKCA